MKLSKVLKESASPAGEVPKNSWDAFEKAFQHIVRARKLMQKTVILGKAENNRKVADLRNKTKDRVKKPDGSLWNEMDVWNAQQSSYKWNSKYIGFMRDLQEIEGTYLDFLSSRGLGLIGEDDLEEIRLLAVAGTAAEKK